MIRKYTIIHSDIKGIIIHNDIQGIYIMVLREYTNMTNKYAKCEEQSWDKTSKYGSYEDFSCKKAEIGFLKILTPVELLTRLGILFESNGPVVRNLLVCESHAGNLLYFLYHNYEHFQNR